jgi:phosphonate transport system permease protein
MVFDPPPTTPPLSPAAAATIPWHSRFNVLNLTLLAFVLAIVASIPGVHGSGRSLDTWGNLSRFLERFFPPDFSVLPLTLASLLETVQIGVVATAAAIVLSLPLAAVGARTLAPRWSVATARMVLNLIRTIPSLIWALFAVAIVGANPLAGVIALAFYSIGYLGKFFSDAFESVDPEVAQGLKASGADAIQAFQYGLWPAVRPLVWSHALWMLEYNIRSASIIGLVGAGGLGVQLHSYAEYGWWDKFATVLLCLLVVVTLLDVLGEWIRQKITKKINRPLAG